MAISYTIKRPPDFEGSIIPPVLIGAFVAFGGILYGYDTGTMGGILVMQYWRDQFSTGYINPEDNKPDVTTSQTSLVVSILSVGTFFGALLAAPLADKVGRRWAMLLSAAIVFNLGVVLQTVATALPLFIAGRVFAGLGVGLISAMVPLYQSETSPAWIRGAIVGIYQFSLVLGLFIAQIVDNATKNRYDSGSYRIPVAVQFAWSLIVTFGVLFLPESPRYLIKCGRIEDAANSLARLRWLDVNNQSLRNELAEIQANHEYEMSSGKASYLDTWRGTLGKRTFTGCIVQAFQQLAGINFILYYGTRFFNSPGIDDPFLISVITSVVLVVMTLPGLYLIEVLGRRKLLMIGGLGMAVSHFIVAAIGTAVPNSTTANQVLIAFVCLFLSFFACSWGPGSWVVTGELFPLKARAKCLSQTTASNWLLNWAIGYATPYMVDVGPGKAGLQAKVFFVWGGFCLVSSVFVYYFVYETRGLTLEQVDEMYDQIARAWESPKFVSTVTFTDIQHLSVGEKEEHGAVHVEDSSERA